MNHKMSMAFCAALLFTLGRCTDDHSFITKTVGVGEDVTLTCSRKSSSSGVLFWIKLVAGNLPEVYGATYTFDHGTVNKTPRITAEQKPGIYVLHITQTRLSDTAFYYCEEVLELQSTYRNITFLRVKGPDPDITAAIQAFPSDPVHQGDSVTLQCSVLFDSERKTCPDRSVYWFRVGSKESHPSVVDIYRNSDDSKCESVPEADSPRKCVYNFSRNGEISSSDAGTYYCAVSTCGEILFGNGTKLDVEGTNISSCDDLKRTTTVLFLLGAALALSLIVIALLIYTIKKNKYHCFNAAAAAQSHAPTTSGDRQSQQADEEDLVYSVPNFTKKKVGRSVRRDAEAAGADSIYADVRVLGYELQHSH